MRWRTALFKAQGCSPAPMANEVNIPPLIHHFAAVFRHLGHKKKNANLGKKNNKDVSSCCYNPRAVPAGSGSQVWGRTQHPAQEFALFYLQGLMSSRRDITKIFLEHWDARGIPCAGQMGEGLGVPPACQERIGDVTRLSIPSGCSTSHPLIIIIIMTTTTTTATTATTATTTTPLTLTITTSFLQAAPRQSSTR